MDADHGGASYVRDMIKQLVACAGAAMRDNVRRQMRRVSAWIGATTRRKLGIAIRERPRASLLYQYFTDGWSVKVVERDDKKGPQGSLQQKAATKLEFCQERAIVRQSQLGGEDRLFLVAGEARALRLGRRHGHFFTAAVEFEPDFSEAKGPLSMVFVMDGLQYRAFMRLMRGRAALRFTVDEEFSGEWDRVLTWSRHWTLGMKCKSHGCSNSVVWSVKRYSTAEIKDDAHIAILALRNSSKDLRDLMEEFATARAAPVERDIDGGQAREVWKFLLVRPDLLSWFVEADPVWDGVNLLVNASFLNQAGGMDKLVTMLCYCASWWNWSETRWCAVKYSSRKLLRSEVVGIRHVVRREQRHGKQLHQRLRPLHRGMPLLPVRCRVQLAACRGCAYPVAEGQSFVEALPSDTHYHGGAPRVCLQLEPAALGEAARCGWGKQDMAALAQRVHPLGGHRCRLHGDGCLQRGEGVSVEVHSGRHRAQCGGHWRHADG